MWHMKDKLGHLVAANKAAAPTDAKWAAVAGLSAAQADTDRQKTITDASDVANAVEGISTRKDGAHALEHSLMRAVVAVYTTTVISKEAATEAETPKTLAR